MHRSPVSSPQLRAHRPSLDALRSAFSNEEIAVIRRAYQHAGARYGESEVGMWAWLLAQQRRAAGRR